MVSAESGQLLALVKNMQQTVTSIESTKSTLKIRYRQMAADWTDKKYQDLGAIVMECDKALNEVLMILLQAEKYVAMLAKSLQQYENVTWNTASGDSSSAQQGQASGAGTGGQQDCLGVLSPGNTPAGYPDVLSRRHENAAEDVRRVFDRFADRLLIRDNTLAHGQTAHYSPGGPGGRQGVYYNAADDLQNPRGAGTTYFHELAHMIDHMAGEGRGNLSATPEFAAALRADGQAMLALYQSLRPEDRAAFRRRISQGYTHSVSDLLDATTGGQLRGSYGHTPQYWQRPGNLQAEAFAHFFEASMGNVEKRDLLANFFPTAFGIFSTMMESLQPDEHIHTLRR